jgi:hypothetical protein
VGGWGVNRESAKNVASGVKFLQKLRAVGWRFQNAPPLLAIFAHVFAHVFANISARNRAQAGQFYIGHLFRDRIG